MSLMHKLVSTLMNGTVCEQRHWRTYANNTSAALIVYVQSKLWTWQLQLCDR